ncbi:hypothetical protein QQF64_013939 [Cirrhinus molitorella]|uniref:Uncharacterized protein n=1 Tax=Cirrhinus molitorella TaxID=172907 RepID=A0ABR3LSJ5_9TELE
MEGRVRSERQREGLYCVLFSLSGRKPGQGENLIGCDSVVKQTSSNIASELQKRRPGVWERTDRWCVSVCCVTGCCALTGQRSAICGEQENFELTDRGRRRLGHTEWESRVVPSDSRRRDLANPVLVISSGLFSPIEHWNLLPGQDLPASSYSAVLEACAETTSHVGIVTTSMGRNTH